MWQNNQDYVANDKRVLLWLQCDLHQVCSLKSTCSYLHTIYSSGCVTTSNMLSQLLSHKVVVYSLMNSVTSWREYACTSLGWCPTTVIFCVHILQRSIDTTLVSSSIQPWMDAKEMEPWDPSTPTCLATALCHDRRGRLLTDGRNHMCSG